MGQHLQQFVQCRALRTQEPHALAQHGARVLAVNYTHTFMRQYLPILPFCKRVHVTRVGVAGLAKHFDVQVGFCIDLRNDAVF